MIRKIYDETPRDYRYMKDRKHMVMLGAESGHGHRVTDLEGLSTSELERIVARYHSRDRARDCVGVHTHGSALGGSGDRYRVRRRRY